MSLLFPAALSALAALLLPLLIHLSRRSELRPTDFAALRWLQAQMRPRRRLRFDDLPLLLLRLLLLALIALWLAQPVLHSTDRTPYVAVMPGVTRAAIANESLPTDARRHWLIQGLPTLDKPAALTPQPIDSLLRQIDAELPAGAPLIVLATAQFDGADAQRPILSRKLDWRIVDGEPPALIPAASPPPRLRIYSDAAHATALRYLRAAASAWQAGEAGYTLQGVDDAVPDNVDETVVWLGAGSLPSDMLRWIESGGTALLDADVPADNNTTALWRDENGEVLVEGRTLQRGRWLRFTRPLQPQAFPSLLDADFPQRLRDLLQPVQQAPTRADARTHAPLLVGSASAELPQEDVQLKSNPQAARDLQPWLALIIALLFAAERWLATRQRGVTT